MPYDDTEIQNSYKYEDYLSRQKDYMSSQNIKFSQLGCLKKRTLQVHPFIAVATPKTLNAPSC